MHETRLPTLRTFTILVRIITPFLQSQLTRYFLIDSHRRVQPNQKVTKKVPGGPAHSRPHAYGADPHSAETQASPVLQRASLGVLGLVQEPGGQATRRHPVADKSFEVTGHQRER